MPTRSPALLVLTNVPDQGVARLIAQQVVDRQLAACVNILPAVQSVYRWQGRVEEAGEVALFIKTTVACYDELQREICALHPYEVPEVIALPIADGLPAYLDWIEQEVRKNSDV